MKVTITFENTKEQDGCEGVVIVQSPDVDDTQDLLDLYSRASRAAGFTYWDRTGYSTDSGEMTWEYPF